jgi:hypothetical protein
VTSTPKRHMSPFNNNDMKNILTNSSHLSRSTESLHSGTSEFISSFISSYLFRLS